MRNAAALLQLDQHQLRTADTYAGESSSISKLTAATPSNPAPSLALNSGVGFAMDDGSYLVPNSTVPSNQQSEEIIRKSPVGPTKIDGVSSGKKRSPLIVGSASAVSGTEDDDLEDEDEEDSMDVDTGCGARKVALRIPDSVDLVMERANRNIKINSISEVNKQP